MALPSKPHFSVRILELNYIKLYAQLVALTSVRTGKTGLLFVCLCRLCVQPTLLKVNSWHVSRSPIWFKWKCKRHSWILPFYHRLHLSQILKQKIQLTAQLSCLAFKALIWMREVGDEFLHALTSLQKTSSNTEEYFKSNGSSCALVPVCRDENHQLTSYSY